MEDVVVPLELVTDEEGALETLGQDALVLAQQVDEGVLDGVDGLQVHPALLPAFLRGAKLKGRSRVFVFNRRRIR